MSKVLVINDADFSTNALDIITFGDEIPCTAVTLNKETDSLNVGESVQLLATKTPANTTDELLWSTSDSNVAVVNNGLVSAVGVGSATITATCGNATAVCTFENVAYMDGDNLLVRIGYIVGGAAVSDGGNGLATWDSEHARHGGFASETGELSFYKPTTVFPYPFPNNTNRIKISYPTASDIKYITRIYWFNKSTNASGYPEYCRLLKMDQNSDLSPSSSGDNTVYLVEIPVVQDQPVVDAFAIDFITKDAVSTMTQAIMDNITVEFLHVADT